MTALDDMAQQGLDLGDVVPAARRKEHCKACRAAVFYAPTEKGRVGIFDWEPDPEGRIVLGSDGVARYRKDGAVAVVGETRWTSHFATCPAADRFR